MEIYRNSLKLRESKNVIYVYTSPSVVDVAIIAADVPFFHLALEESATQGVELLYCVPNALVAINLLKYSGTVSVIIDGVDYYVSLQNRALINAPYKRKTRKITEDDEWYTFDADSKSEYTRVNELLYKAKESLHAST